MSFRADRLRSRRVELDLSRAQVAVEADCSSSSISEYESGRVVPPPGRIERLAQILDTPVDYLLDGEVPAYDDPAVLARAAAILNAHRPPAEHEGPEQNQGPGLGLSTYCSGDLGPEVKDAA